MSTRTTDHRPRHPSMDAEPQPTGTQGYSPSHSMAVASASTSSVAHHQHHADEQREGSSLPQWEAIETSPSGSSKKVRAKPATDRTPGTTLIPTSKVESIVSTSGSNGPLSKEAIYVLTVATEEFIKKLTTVSYVRADIEKRAITGYGDVADTVDKFPEFHFLAESVPRPLPLSEALATRQTLEQQRESYLDKVAEEAAQRQRDTEGEMDEGTHPTIQPESISTAKGKEKAHAVNGSTASKAKSGKGKAKASNGSGTAAPPQTPSLRSERLKNKRAKIEQDNADAVAESGNAQEPAPSVMDSEVEGVYVAVSDASTSVGDGMSISTGPSQAKSKSKSVKAVVTSPHGAPLNTPDQQQPAQSSNSTVPPSMSGPGSSGYKIKIKPRQHSSNSVPLTSALSQGVENVSNSLAYASLYTTPTASVNADDGTPPAKRPRLSLRTTPTPTTAQQSNVRDTPLPQANGTVAEAADLSHKSKKSKSTNSNKKSKSSTSKKGDTAQAVTKQQAATNISFAEPIECGPETSKPLYTNVPLPTPPSAVASPQKNGATSSAGLPSSQSSTLNSPLSPPPELTNGTTHLLRAASSPSTLQ